MYIKYVYVLASWYVLCQQRFVNRHDALIQHVGVNKHVGVNVDEMAAVLGTREIQVS